MAIGREQDRRSADPPQAQLAERLRSARSLTVLTGAGMSAESGIPTFRDALTGLWERFDPAQLATPEAFRRDPALVWGWYASRMAGVRAAQPHAGHRALAVLQDRIARLTIVTQNVDDLHERAGSREVVHLHGSLFASRCFDCGTPCDVEPVGSGAQASVRMPPPACAACGGPLRPGVVWFGEMLPVEAWQRAVAAVADSDLVLVVGTSGLVYPAASLPALAREAGAFVAEINPHPSGLEVDLQWPVGAAAGLEALTRAW